MQIGHWNIKKGQLNQELKTVKISSFSLSFFTTNNSVKLQKLTKSATTKEIVCTCASRGSKIDFIIVLNDPKENHGDYCSMGLEKQLQIGTWLKTRHAALEWTEKACHESWAFCCPFISWWWISTDFALPALVNQSNHLS